MFYTKLTREDFVPCRWTPDSGVPEFYYMSNVSQN